jgi:O-antigen ligase
MRFAAFLLVLLLIAKDASYLGDRFIMRGISQGLCFAVGALWIMGNIPRIQWSRYVVLATYVLVLIVTSCYSPYSRDALIQVASLVTVLVFAVAATEHVQRQNIMHTIMNTTFGCYLLVCIVSLILLKVAPNLVFQIGDIAGDKRFSGVYGRPAMLGAASGILIGIALFHDFRGGAVVSALRVLAVSVGMICLWLSGARTFWIGFLCAVPAVAFLKYDSKAKLVVWTSLAALVVVLAIQTFSLTLSEKTKEEKLRVGSVSTLTGRTAIWEGTFRVLQERPLLGFGFGMSGFGVALKANQSAYLVEERSKNSGTAPTLHNGYVQAFGDSGIAGGVIYCALIVMALVKAVRRRVVKQQAAAAFVLIFLAVANLAESIVFKASVWHSALFWLLMVYALGISPKESRSPTSRQKAAYTNVLRT